ncbi:MAG: hypothetical protein QNI85_09845, partial [Desulfobacterales bacterium]|nr:hypothetical protein [Desulfobacterales bacterium]
QPPLIYFLHSGGQLPPIPFPASGFWFIRIFLVGFEDGVGDLIKLSLKLARAITGNNGNVFSE